METVNLHQVQGKQDWIVVSLGGSIICPDRVDIEYIKSFVAMVKDKVAHGLSFAIITGGGKIARDYRDALIASGVTDVYILDLMGIDATRYNAELIRYSFGGLAEPKIFLDPTNLNLSGKNILVGGGWKPGHSSDGSAVALAQTLGAKKLINLSNIDYVYTADPRKNPDAQKIEKIGWVDFRKLLPEEWNPGISAPFDPIAARMAQEAGMEVAIMNGKNLQNLENYIDGKEFVGTIVN